MPRITPAGAGKTDSALFSVHPFLGSPPQVRGKLSYDTAPGEGSGITPAGAGKTRCS